MRWRKKQRRLAWRSDPPLGGEPVDGEEIVMAGASDAPGRPRRWSWWGRAPLGWLSGRGWRRGGRKLVAEADAVLRGDAYKVVADAAPGWIALNQVAHADLAALSKLAARPAVGDGWQLAVTQLANDLVAAADGNSAEALTLQRRCLVPLELDTLTAVSPTASRAAVTGRVALRSHQASTRRRVEGT